MKRLSLPRIQLKNWQLALVLSCVGGLVHSGSFANDTRPLDSLPTDSLYQSETHWTNSRNEHVMLPMLAGKPQVLAFVYSHCLSMCPVIVADLQLCQILRLCDAGHKRQHRRQQHDFIHLGSSSTR